MGDPTSPTVAGGCGDGDELHGQQEVLDDEPKSILLDIIKQLGAGGDLHRITLPTFVLEPRSMLERITDFMSHPLLLKDAHKEEKDIDRFLCVVRYFLSGWHIKHFKGVKKPYNPILNEFFRCKMMFPDGTKGTYIAEQVSHHPPVSVFYFTSTDNSLIIQGDLRPKPRFTGNSAATLMQGSTTISFTDHKEDYIITMPNVYARGVILGTMYMEVCDNATVRCEQSDLVAELKFDTKGYFSGTFNGITGKIKRISSNATLFEIKGKWSDEIYISPKGVKERTLFFDAHKAVIHPKIVAPESEQDPYESRRLWSKVTQALLAKNMDLATAEKSALEAQQRNEAKERQNANKKFQPRWFDIIESGKEEQYKCKYHDEIVAAGAQGTARLEALCFGSPTS